MKKSIGLFALIALVIVAFQGCAWVSKDKKSIIKPPGDVYKDEVRLKRTIELRAINLPSGDPNCHNCIEGNYIYRYETDNGLSGREVWLCCVPINELLRGSFNCADGFLMSLIGIGDEDYLKVRYCHLLHPTSSDPIYIPVCIPAPLVAPNIGGQ